MLPEVLPNLGSVNFCRFKIISWHRSQQSVVNNWHYSLCLKYSGTFFRNDDRWSDRFIVVALQVCYV